MIPDYRLHNILAIIGALAFNFLLLQMTVVQDKYTPSLVVATCVWGSFIIWEQITDHGGSTVLSDERMITKILFTRNGSHISMAGDSHFARGPVVDKIGLDGKGKGADEMLQDNSSTDMEGLNGVTVSSEMNIFIKALQIPISATTDRRFPQWI